MVEHSEMWTTSGQLPSAPRCPTCGAVLDGFTACQPGTEPQDGDPTVCCYCATILVFTAAPPLADLQLRAATQAQIDEFVSSAPELPAIVQAIRETLAEQPAPRGIFFSGARG